jgi:hypothetical protein
MNLRPCAVEGCFESGQLSHSGIWLCYPHARVIEILGKRVIPPPPQRVVVPTPDQRVAIIEIDNGTRIEVGSWSGGSHPQGPYAHIELIFHRPGMAESHRFYTDDALVRKALTEGG